MTKKKNLLKIKVSNEILYTNIDDWKAQKDFRKEKEKAFVNFTRNLFLT